MTEVAFHFNAVDKSAYTCRLLRKALAKDARVVVLTTAGNSAALSQRLWTLSPGDFVPHGQEADGQLVQSRSPILLVESSLPSVFQADVLVNLTDEVPEGYETFDRVIEVVSQAESDRSQARERWRQYLSMGITPLRHDLKVPAG